jgi:broad specificity polyphosphatase/5'/3'-nucleotidase SurE
MVIFRDFGWDKEWTLMESIGDIRRYKRSGKFVRAMQDDTKSDIWALEHGFVSVVPLLSNLTDNQKIDTLKKLFE